MGSHKKSIEKVNRYIEWCMLIKQKDVALQRLYKILKQNLPKSPLIHISPDCQKPLLGIILPEIHPPHDDHNCEK